MKNNSFNLQAVDFFCGAGGLTYGLRAAGVKVIAGIDNDSVCQVAFEKNNAGTLFLKRDVSKYPPPALTADLKIKKKDDYMVFAACAPCQFWTQINTNKRKSEKTQNLILDFKKFVEYFKPGFVFMENVPGISSKKPIKIFIRALQNMKYHVSDKIVDMSLYGVPQKRKRFTLLASRISKISFPKPQKSQVAVKNVLGEQNGFPPIKAGTKDATDFLHAAARLSAKNIQRLKMTEKDGGDRRGWMTNKRLQLPCYIRKKNTFSDTYARMRWNQPAPTITTRFTSVSNGRFAHPDEHRGISLREGAVLQTFPKQYQFIEANMAATAKMIGNAVPPRFAEIMGKRIIQSIKEAI